VSTYFVVGCSADGITFDAMSQHELEQRLADGYYGVRRKIFATKVPTVDGFAFEMDENELLIIKGEIVTPQPEEVVKRWSLR
jgi:hypothetical protein